MGTFGTRENDSPKDSAGNVLADLKQTFYASRADAEAQANPLGSATTGNPKVETGGWPAFVQAMYDLAATDKDICIFDAQQRMWEGSGNDPVQGKRLLSGDLVHPSSAGHKYLARAMARFLQPS